MWEEGFDNIPKPFGITADGREEVSFVEGIVYNDHTPDFLLSDEVLIDAAKLLRRYHISGAKYLSRLTGQEEWMLPARAPAEVMCHGDFAPYNLTFIGDELYGIIDFDTLHPGPRLWDIAYAVYRWVPFMAPTNLECRHDLSEQVRRLGLFAESYGLSEDEKRSLPGMMIERIRALTDFMRAQSEEGSEDFQKNIEDGHLKLYLDDIAYLTEHESTVVNGIL